MKTKAPCLSFKDKRVFVNSNSADTRYNNLNLNHNNHQYFPVDTVSSKNVVNERIKSANYGSYNNLSQTRKDSIQSNHHFDKTTNHLNTDQSCFKKEFKSKGKNNSRTSSSTLSLHISAYENSIEALPSDSVDENKQSDLIKNWEKETLVESPSNIQSPYDLPRQQGPETTKPEIAKFKASQKLFNPNESSASKSSINHRNHLKNHDNHHHRHHHQGPNSHGALDLIILQNKMYVPSMFHAAQETSLAMTAIRYKQNEIEYHKALAMGRKMPSNTPEFLNPASFPQNHAPTWLPLIRILPFTTPQMQSSATHVKEKKHQQHPPHSNNLTESISMTADDDNVFLPTGISSPLKLEKPKPLKNNVSPQQYQQHQQQHCYHNHHQHNHSSDVSPTLSPALSHSDTLSPSEIHVPIDSIFHGTKKLNKKTIRKRRAVVAGKAISLADLESKLIGTTGEGHE